MTAIGFLTSIVGWAWDIGKTKKNDGILWLLYTHIQYPQHTTEWAIPYENSQACLCEVREYLQKEQKNPHGIRPHFPIEIRFSAPDDIWLSPSYARQTCWIGIVQYKWGCLSRIWSTYKLIHSFFQALWFQRTLSWIFPSIRKNSCPAPRPTPLGQTPSSAAGWTSGFISLFRWLHSGSRHCWSHGYLSQRIYPPSYYGESGGRKSFQVNSVILNCLMTENKNILPRGYIF